MTGQIVFDDFVLKIILSYHDACIAIEKSKDRQRPYCCALIYVLLLKHIIKQGPMSCSYLMPLILLFSTFIQVNISKVTKNLSQPTRCVAITTEQQQSYRSAQSGIDHGCCCSFPTRIIDALLCNNHRIVFIRFGSIFLITASPIACACTYFKKTVAKSLCVDSAEMYDVQCFFFSLTAVFLSLSLSHPLLLY